MTLNLNRPSPPTLCHHTGQPTNQQPTHSYTMASKRKSTVPCMIPSKTKHMREEIILGCLPELLPTIPEDSILSISGEEGGHSSHDSSRPEGVDRWQRGGTFSCPPCRFEARDLNFFLDHLHNCHVDFRAQASFYCLNCGVSVVRFEALALHNAKAHPGLVGGSVNASLHVRKRDGLTTVEQSLFTANGEDFSESSGISLTKTPIVRMMKTKGEHKKIVVSHTVEVRRIDTGKEMERTDPTILMNVPELQNGTLSENGAPTMLRKPVTHVMTTVPNQAFHQHTPSLYSSSSSDSSKDLPKVMIPLSSIPTYDAAMDTSSFLKTSFGKFPYPTKAELCYLTVVSDFPEEQIKLWFTAHRLKQGISWSPEEIEEARRKMFNTVFQAAAPQKQPPKQRHNNHIVTHHTITAQPAPVGLNCHAAKVLHGSLISRRTGVVASQASMSASQQVTSRVSYAVPAITTKYPMVVRTTQVLTRNTVPTPESDKSVGLGLDMAGSNSCVISTRSSSSASSCSSSSSISSFSSISSNGGENGTRKSMNNSSLSHSIISCSTNISNNDECSIDNNEKPYSKSNSIPSVLESFCSSNNKSKVIMNTTSKSNVICNSHSNSSISNQDQYPSAKIDDDSNNNYSHKSNNGSVSSDYSITSNNDCANNLNHASIAQNENTSTTVITKSSSSSCSSISIVEEKKCIKEFPMKGMSVLQQLIKEEDQVEDRTCPELKVDPTKINLRRLKVNEPDAKPGSEAVPPELMPEIQEIPTSHLSFSAPWGKKTPQQVHLLRQAFSSTHWPSSQQYEELSVMTGLPKPEVVRWFSDSRYIHKNGQLKWLEGYQHLPAEGEEGKGFTNPGAETLKDLQIIQRKLAEQDVNKQLEEVPGRLTAWQQDVWRDTYTPLLSLTGTEETGEGGKAVEAVKTGYVQDHWAEREDEHQQPVSSQVFAEQQAEGSQARDRLRIELLEV